MYGLLIAFSLLQGPTLPAPVGGAPTLELDPPQVMTMPGQPFRVRAKTNAGKAFFDVEGPTSLPDDWPIADRKTCYYGFAPSANGTYTITVTVYGGDERVIRKCLVIVGSQPTPPGPGPVPPTPNDPLFAELQLLFAADIDPNKSAAARSLASLYSTAGQAALKDLTVATTAQFLAKLRAASKILLPDDALTKIRDRLKAEFAACLGTADVPLTPEMRTKASECLHRLALLLEALR